MNSNRHQYTGQDRTEQDKNLMTERSILFAVVICINESENYFVN